MHVPVAQKHVNNCRVQHLASQQGVASETVLSFLLSMAGRPLARAVSPKTVAAALDATQPPPPLPETAPPSPGSSQSSAHEYDAAWQEGDQLSDWDSDDAISPRNGARSRGHDDDLASGDESYTPQWVTNQLELVPEGTPGLARTSVAAVTFARDVVQPSTAALAYPELPLPFVQTALFLHDQVQPGDLTAVLDGPKRLGSTQSADCYQDAAVSQHCLQLLLVRHHCVSAVQCCPHLCPFKAAEAYTAKQHTGPKNGCDAFACERCKW